MPTISYFYGIKIFINPNDHNPPHFHAEYAEFSAHVDIKQGNIIAGKIPPKAKALIEEWRMIHVDELMENWNLMKAFQELKPIKGLS